MTTDDAVHRWVTLVGEGLRLRVEEIVQVELGRMRSEAPTFFTSDDPDYVTAYTNSCRSHLATMVDCITSGCDLPTGLPAAAVEETRTVAQWGISLDALIQTYRTGHAVIWEAAMEVADEVVPSNQVRSQALKVVSRYLFAYTDRMVVLLTEVYEGERTTLLHDRGRRRRQLVRDLLDGLPTDTSKLPYVITGVHMAAIATGNEPERALLQLAARAQLSCLTVAGPSGSTWGWIGGVGLRSVDVQQQLTAAVPPGVVLGLGHVAEGVEGFRSSHHQARQAYRIGRRAGWPVVRYADVALLALATQDERLARTFMQGELGYLAADDPRAAELRTTLQAYFAAGHNASATGTRLSVNDRTVAYRLRTIEERLGHPILERRDELAVALRMFDLYAAEAGEDAGRRVVRDPTS